MRGVIALILIVVFLTVAGCGETFNGFGKDARRIGKGVKTIFVKDE